MKIVYAPTYELKDDCGYSSPAGIVFEDIDTLKDKISFDGQSDDYRIASLDITFDDTVSLYFDYPKTLKVFYHSSADMHYQIAKFDDYCIADLIHYLDEYM